MPDFEALDTQQKLLVAEIFRTQQSIPHRFICLDRLDSIKGIHIILGAIELYLDNLGVGLNALQNSYRFFFLMDYYENTLLWIRGTRGISILTTFAE